MRAKRRGSSRLRRSGRLGLPLIAVVCCFPVLMGSGSARAQSNLIINGDFSQGLIGWEWADSPGTAHQSSDVRVVEGELRIVAGVDSLGSGGASAHAQQTTPLPDLTPVLTGFLSTESQSTGIAHAEADMALIYSNASGEEVFRSIHGEIPPGGIALETDCDCASPETVSELTVRFEASASALPNFGTAGASLRADNLRLAVPLAVDSSGVVHR